MANLKAAGQKGVGPLIVAAGPEAEFVVMEYIPPQQDAGLVGEKYAASLGETLRRVHERDDRAAHASIFTHIVSLIQKAPIPKDSHGYKVIQTLLKAMWKIQESFRGEEVTPTHGDIHRDNVLFDGQRFWLIDWENSQLKNPYEDLTQMMNFIILDAEQEADFLKHYFNHVPSEAEESKFYLMRIVTLLHAGLQDLNRLGHSAYQISQETFKNLPDYTVLVRKALRGEIPITENIKKIYAWGLIKQAYRYVKERKFNKSIRALKSDVYHNNRKLKYSAQEALKGAAQSALLKETI